MESLPPLPKPANSGSSRPDPIKPWRHTPHPDPSALWCPVCKAHTEYQPREFLGPRYESSTSSTDNVTNTCISGSRIYTRYVCQQCKTIPPFYPHIRGQPDRPGLYHLEGDMTQKYEPDWGGMFIPKDELPKGNVQNLTIFSFGITAIGYLVLNSIPGVVLPLTLLLLFFVSFFCFCAGLWLLLFLSKWKRWWAWKRWAKQQGAQTSVANLAIGCGPHE